MMLRWQVEDTFLGKELSGEVIQLQGTVNMPDLRSQIILVIWTGGRFTGVPMLMIRRRIIYGVFQDVQVV